MASWLWVCMLRRVRLQLQVSLHQSLWCSLRDSLRRSLRDSLRRSFCDSLRRSLRDSLRRSLRDSLRCSLRDSFGRPFCDALGGPFRYALWDRRGGNEARKNGNKEKICLGTHLLVMMWLSTLQYPGCLKSNIYNEWREVWWGFACWQTMAKGRIHRIYTSGCCLTGLAWEFDRLF
jgi:hypothetical protein